MSLDLLLKEIAILDEQKHWQKQAPEDLAKSIVIEAAELLEHFQWDQTIINRGHRISLKDKKELGFEAADIFVYLLKFCRELDIDLIEITREKLKVVKEKYPDIK
ncbi:MAG: nucleotide pyrophosphohydrolase [Bacteroidetes bacterium]|nr:nucleotide pyrophosphohydrolase [Bacteroidota bacterium]